MYLVVNISRAADLISRICSLFCFYSITLFQIVCQLFSKSMVVAKIRSMVGLTSNGVMVVVNGFVSSREARPLGDTLVATTIQPAPPLLTPHSTPCCRRGVSRPTRLHHTWTPTTRETPWAPCRATVAGSLCIPTSASRDCLSMTWIVSSSNHLLSVSHHHLWAIENIVVW
jgi:hypothetical protein